MTGAMLRKPTKRVCERCGRRERWNIEQECWMIVKEKGEKVIGDPHCIHEWDINGKFRPFD